MIPTNDPRFATGYITDTDPRKAFTPVGIGRFPKLLTPTPKYKKPGELEFSMSLLFPETAVLAILQQLAMNAAIAAGWGSDPSQWPQGWNQHPTFKEQNTKNKEGFAKTPGHKYILLAAKPEYPPTVYDHLGNKLGTAPGDAAKVYDGVVGWALVHAYTYGDPKRPGDGVGIKFGLDGFQILAEGKRYGNDNSSHFGAVAVPGGAAPAAAGAATAPAANAFG